MKTARYSDAQIMGILKQAEGGTHRLPPDAMQMGRAPTDRWRGDDGAGCCKLPITSDLVAAVTCPSCR
ncbi:hypothetical protein [Shimia abyssi]|uniref:Uncharacterized protein n=1 Tax=Shimia abyssi TaxID=1662395 RepID=A0A2P8F7C0_9RHOB|nr:hypothetical protein [Shimia abyssi]PSL17597.1 hypothetical protein CLV88_11644 [Shimia abyssi]